MAEGGLDVLVFAISHIGEIVHAARDCLLVEHQKSRPQPISSLFSSKIDPSKPRVVSSHSLVWKLLQKDEEERKLLKACDKGDTDYLEERLFQEFVMAVFQHLLSQNQDLVRKVDRAFSHRNLDQVERLRFREEALKGSVVVIYEKASEGQKISIILSLFNENKYHLFVLLRMSDKIAMMFIDYLFSQNWIDKQIREREAILNTVFKQHTSALVEKFSGHRGFGNVFYYLDDEVKLKVVLTLFDQGKARVFKRCLEDPQVADDAFFALFFNWRKYEKIEGSSELLEMVLKKIKFEKFPGRMTRETECYLERRSKETTSKSLHVAIHSISNPALFEHLGKVLPLISDQSGLIQMACEHGDIKSLDFLMQAAGIKKLSISCVVNSARFGHIAVVEQLLNDPALTFKDNGRVVPRLKVALSSLLSASSEDEGKMVSALLEWVYKNNNDSLSFALTMVLDNAAQNRKYRGVGYFEPRRALLALHTFCTKVSYQFPIPVLERAKDLAEIDAADEKSAQIIQNWITQCEETFFPDKDKNIKV